MDKQNRYKPVRHTKAMTARLLAADPELKKAYDALEDEFAALDALLTARQKAGLSQAEVARRMKIKPSSLARIEASLVSREHSPSFTTLRKYAAACGRKLIIKFA
jgi:ribosome-binding protein aMBF1 (putative translation factor)